MCVLNFEFSSMHDKDFFFMAFFLPDCRLNTKFCSRSLPVPLSYLFQTPCDMISQAVPVIEMMNGLEKPIKTFCYKKKAFFGIVLSRASRFVFQRLRMLSRFTLLLNTLASLLPLPAQLLTTPPWLWTSPPTTCDIAITPCLHPKSAILGISFS